MPSRDTTARPSPTPPPAPADRSNKVSPSLPAFNPSQELQSHLNPIGNPKTDSVTPGLSLADVRRASSTEIAIIDAFIALTLEQRYDAIRVADLIGRAGVGKSTFYEHFRGKEDVLLAAMQPVLLVLATAASGRAARSYVRAMVEHLWERRSVGRPIMDSAAAAIIQRRLAHAIVAHGVGGGDAANAPLFAVGIAAAQLAMLRCWLAGHVAVTIDAMTDQLIACSRLRDIDRPL